jgi:hypothetical protein
MGGGVPRVCLIFALFRQERVYSTSVAPSRCGHELTPGNVVSAERQALALPPTWVGAEHAAAWRRKHIAVA